MTEPTRPNRFEVHPVGKDYGIFDNTRKKPVPTVLGHDKKVLEEIAINLNISPPESLNLG